MNTIKETVLMVCIILIAVELICKIVPDNNMLTFVKGLVFVMLFISIISSITNLDLSLNVSKEGIDISDNELYQYVEEQYEDSAVTQTREYIEELLYSIDIEYKEIEIFTDKNEDSSILIEKVRVELVYKSDKDRAKALLEGALGEDVKIEVKISG